MGGPIALVDIKEMDKENGTLDLATPSDSFRMSYNTTKSSWLTSTLSDLDMRMKALALKLPAGDDSDYSFRDRADFYYDKRPQLVELLQDLYNAYLALSDKYTQSLLKQNHHCRQSSLVSFMDNDFDFGREDGSSILINSDTHSSLSFHHQALSMIPLKNIKHADDIVTDIVMKNVEFGMLVDEVADMEKQASESSRKIELQNGLLDVLESERLMLLNENAELRSQVTILVREKKRLASESLMVKRKANEMAKLLLRMRDQQSKNMVLKIEDLKDNIQRLDKKNGYYEQLVKKDYYEELENGQHYEHFVMKKHKNNAEKSMKEAKNVAKADLQICLARGNKRETIRNPKHNHAKNGSKWWEKMKTKGLFHCRCQGSS